jgi:predicted metal-binding membrane protein
MTTLDIGYLSRTLRHVRPPVLVVMMMAPVSLLLLYLWSSTPSPGSPHGVDAAGTSPVTRSIVFLTAWMLMTAAMMLPSAMPLLVSLDRIARRQPDRQAMPAVAAFAYLAVWGGVGIAALASSALAGAYFVPRVGAEALSRVAGAGLVMAGLYGLSPLAGACLRACRRPFGFLARYWRGGSGARLQAARIGAAYGVSCVGCCVPMIGAMFVVGMANIAIVIAMGVLMAIMKTSAAGARIAQALSVALIAVGLAVAFALVPFTPSHH